MPEYPETIAFWRGRLPHWEVVGGRYFVTIHLAGALPAEASARIHRMSQQLRDCKGGEYLRLAKRVFAAMESHLDRAPSVHHFMHAQVAGEVQEAIAYRQRHRIWDVFEYVVMPSHIHLFIEVAEGSLKQSLESFKDWTAHRAADVLGPHGVRFWQKEWFDHWARTPQEEDRIREYIRRNPVRGRLVADYRDWPFGSW